MAFVVLEAAGIDDAAAIEGEARLALEPGNVVHTAERKPVLGAVEHARIEQAIDVARLHRAIADAAFRPLHLDQRLEPIQPTRARAYDLDLSSALLEGLAEGARDLLGADAQRARIARDEDARGHACASFSN